jgi:hypothetical protein
LGIVTSVNPFEACRPAARDARFTDHYGQPSCTAAYLGAAVMSLIQAHLATLREYPPGGGRRR